jgi:hypothetical protein
MGRFSSPTTAAWRRCKRGSTEVSRHLAAGTVGFAPSRRAPPRPGGLAERSACLLANRPTVHQGGHAATEPAATPTHHDLGRRHALRWLGARCDRTGTERPHGRHLVRRPGGRPISQTAGIGLADHLAGQQCRHERSPRTTTTWSRRWYGRRRAAPAGGSCATRARRRWRHRPEPGAPDDWRTRSSQRFG